MFGYHIHQTASRALAKCSEQKVGNLMEKADLAADCKSAGLVAGKASENHG